MRASKKQNIMLWSQIALGLICLYLVFKKDVQIINPPKKGDVINNITNKQEKIYKTEQSIIPNNAEIRKLNGTVADLMEEILYLKSHGDTAILVETQDTLIGTLYKQGQIKDTVINKQQLIIVDLKSISKSKDTLLMISDAKVKKIRRQRNIFMITTGILTAISIIK